MGRFGFWLPALLWLPGGIIADEVLRTGSAYGIVTPSTLVELTLAAPCGIPLALGVAAVAGLLGQVAVGFQALLVSLPVWPVAWRLGRRPRGLEFVPSSRRPGRRGSRGPFRP